MDSSRIHLAIPSVPGKLDDQPFGFFWGIPAGVTATEASSATMVKIKSQSFYRRHASWVHFATMSATTMSSRRFVRAQRR